MTNPQIAAGSTIVLASGNIQKILEAKITFAKQKINVLSIYEIAHALGVDGDSEDFKTLIDLPEDGLSTTENSEQKLNAATEILRKYYDEEIHGKNVYIMADDTEHVLGGVTWNEELVDKFLSKAIDGDPQKREYIVNTMSGKEFPGILAMRVVKNYGANSWGSLNEEGKELLEEYARLGKEASSDGRIEYSMKTSITLRKIDEDEVHHFSGELSGEFKWPVDDQTHGLEKVATAWFVEFAFHLDGIEASWAYFDLEARTEISAGSTAYRQVFEFIEKPSPVMGTEVGSSEKLDGVDSRSK